MTIAALALAVALDEISSDDEFAQIYFESLGTVLRWFKANQNMLPLRAIDKRLLDSAVDVHGVFAVGLEQRA